MDQSELPALDENAAQERLLHPARNAVITLFKNDQDQVLLMRTRRLPGSWQPVGGGIEDGDPSPLAAAVREIEEELGLAIAMEQLQHIADFPYDFGVGAIYCYVAAWPKDASLVNIATNEVAEIKWFAIADAQELQAFPATKSLLALIK